MNADQQRTPAVRHRRGYWSMAVLGLVLIGFGIWEITREAKTALLEQARRNFEAQSQLYAQVIGNWSQSLQREMIALAEQKAIRQEIARWKPGAFGNKGFLETIDAVCRSYTAGDAGVVNFSLRSLDGRRLAGTGIDLDSIHYAEVMRRIQVETILSGKLYGFTQKWTVPVRDVDAQPLAYLSASVAPASAFLDFIQRGGDEGDYLFCLEDTQGTRLWNSDSALTIPGPGYDADHFQLDDRTYEVVKAAIPGTNWILFTAREDIDIQTTIKDLKYLRTKRGIIAAFILLAAAFFATRRKRT
jgi:hypothetical protein